MLNPEAVGRVFLAPRGNRFALIHRLSALVSAVFSPDPFSNQWFVFCNRQRDTLKILRWDYDGFGCITGDWKSRFGWW
jgi:transposase